MIATLLPRGVTDYFRVTATATTTTASTLVVRAVGPARTLFVHAQALIPTSKTVTTGSWLGR